ncbi:hypothetical protein H828_YJM1478I00069 [Saccharomyces cerevisiae YJM1478]|uniref:Uncharacterized protein YIL105W-A n=2 Tax=Saccharomyces cerevisiae TaxID=4932 RepID=YI105_YEAST|nr:uncharacterized protein YIL105W-A [Saccharomyces cerevisiae S288C]Q8TGN5.1 RecName: Full=Uncharacterized protein YIL105W-A [Saccharomyces cerevisiae S288C]AAL79268.1 unknown [Saccharomyces cerevisiae]AHY75902.1 hypothetical protein H779_YJM993I00067 [Saccharomyces cerevisiae YJM993]AJP39370.1 hypothetical protein F842_YJM1078I00069 [Saccharomyces cerevisiae YJM1078]AJR36663.1 hypothetical protein H747_YJM189I00074 [Saccharomyces cerevisiae YJM189]AJR36858.1 hypothetical protein H748_YJM193|eukprot:NP_001257679.1 hypothetical protein YIL105W-A [Saccharomyces cerevisiae S288C]
MKTWMYSYLFDCPILVLPWTPHNYYLYHRFHHFLPLCYWHYSADTY